MKCRICQENIDQCVTFDAPSITSVSTIINAKLELYYCVECDLMQSLDLHEDFYANDYNISLSSDQHDQIYEIKQDGEIVYRTQKQAEVIIELLDIKKDHMILDYGAAKAFTLKYLCEKVNVNPFVFDVSENYSSYWTWLKKENTATFKIPEQWRGKFDFITCHYVFEHISDIKNALTAIKQSLKEDGVVFISVPNPISNLGDLMVIDHVNHFTHKSIDKMLRENGFESIKLIKDKMKDALIVLACKNKKYKSEQVPSSNIYSLAKNWLDIKTNLIYKCHNYDRVIIFGAGFYGTWSFFALNKNKEVVCFIDNNPHLHESELFGIKVKEISHLASLPIEIPIVVSINPRSADLFISNNLKWLQGRSLIKL